MVRKRSEYGQVKCAPTDGLIARIDWFRHLSLHNSQAINDLSRLRGA